MSKLIRSILSLPWIAHLPVRVRGGIADGARWTLFPWTAYWRGTHEPVVQQCLLALRDDWTGQHIWDLGSHYGLFAIGFGLRVGPTGSVAAFEPNSHSYQRLSRHVSLNQLGARIKTFAVAVSEQTGRQELYCYEGMESTTTHLAYEGETRDAGILLVEVPTVRLDDLVASKAIHPPDFIKVDVEGHGHKALQGAADTLARHRPILMIGFHSEAEITGILSMLTPLRYHCRPIDPRSPNEPTSGHDYLFEPVR